MEKIIRLSTEQRENLAAYLDGELDEPTTQEIEQVLAVSEVARHEVDMLSRTWDMLNVLPAAKASEDFTRRTMTTLRTADEPHALVDARAVSRNVRRGTIVALWAASLVVCAIVGFEATHRWIPNESEELLDDFDIIARLDEYRAVGDVEFLHTLKTKRTFADHDEQVEK
jgi:anti-sigma factor RsiW